MPLILDTDPLTILDRRSQPAYDHLHARLLAHPPSEVCTTIISFQEQVKGWMGLLNKARTPAEIIRAYAKLGGLLEGFCKMRVLPFDQAAQNRFAGLMQLRLRVGTMDLRIASIALANDATLLSRNLRDFDKVPGLVVQDWTE